MEPFRSVRGGGTRAWLAAAEASLLYDEDPESQRLRQRLAMQLRAAPALRFVGKGRPTKKDRRDIERLRGE